MAKRPPAGEMRHVVHIERHTGEGTYDSRGQLSASTTAWNRDITVRAKIDVLSGQDGELARQIYPTATHRVTIDYYSTMDTTGATRRRAMFGERTLPIATIINPDQEDVILELICGEER